jgi:cell shape-determining protein MreD
VIRYTASLILLVLLAVILQQFIPAFTPLFGSRLMLVVLVFLCAASTVSAPVMLLLAFLCGFLADAENALATQAGDPEVYTRPVESLRFGYSIALYAVMGYLMQGIQPLFRQGKWQFSALLSGIAVFLYLLVEYLLINFVRGGFSFTRWTFLRIAFSSGITMLLSPVVFWLLFQLADRSQYRIRFDGLKRRTRTPAY